MSHQRKIFKLIIMPTRNALQLLQWIRGHIRDLSSCGVGIKIQKINKDEFDSDMVDTLRKRGITNLPALISPSGKLYIGNNDIISMFSGGLTKAHASSRVNNLMDTNDIDVNDYLAREIVNGMQKTPNGYVDNDDDEDSEDDLRRRLNAYQKKAPKQHKPRNPAEYETNLPPRGKKRSGGRRPPPPPEDDEYDDYDDNYDRYNGRDRYDDDDDMGRNNTAEDQYDDLILNTLMSNVPTPGA